MSRTFDQFCSFFEHKEGRFESPVKEQYYIVYWFGEDEAYEVKALRLGPSGQYQVQFDHENRFVPAWWMDVEPSDNSFGIKYNQISVKMRLWNASFN